MAFYDEGHRLALMVRYLKDPYHVLGIARGATADQIKQSYRALARELHPDVNPGDKKAEERFKEITAAYDFLSDADKRGKFDRGEIDATGAPKQRTHTHHRAGGFGPNPGFGAGGFGGGAFDFGNDPNEILAEMMRRKEKGRKGWGSAWGFGMGEEADPPKSGQDAHHSLKVSFGEAAAGTTKRVKLATGKSLDVRIPPGSIDGQTLRLKGQGYPGQNGGPAGDAFIDIKVDPHSHLVRRDQDILLDLPISVGEAVTGAKITVPTADGQVTVSIPPGSNTGTVLRLKGKGMKTDKGVGDQLVTLKVVLPDNDAEFAKFVEKWAGKSSYNPRAKAGL